MIMFTFKKIDMNDRAVIIGAIRACSDRAILEKTFSTFNIEDYKERYDILVDAMYNPEMFFSCEEPDLKQKYELALELFLTMEWKLSAVYEQMGVGK